MRKIIQIAMDSQPAGDVSDAWCVTTALCDDGTVWELEYNRTKGVKEWTMLPEIPQDTAVKNEE